MLFVFMVCLNGLNWCNLLIYTQKKGQNDQKLRLYDVITPWKNNFWKKLIPFFKFSQNSLQDRLGRFFMAYNYYGQNCEKRVFWGFSQFRNTKSLPNGWISQTSYSGPHPVFKISKILHTNPLGYITSKNHSGDTCPTP